VMTYWTIADDIAVAVLVVGALCMYLSFGLTRMTSGAPRAWYVIIAAFAVLFVRGIPELYLDIQAPASRVDIFEETILLAVVVLFAIGLYMLTRTFQKQLDPGRRPY